MAIEPINPASSRGAAERKRVPMSVPVQRLESPDIPGYHLHWFTGSPERIQRALDGGYEFVDERAMLPGHVLQILSNDDAFPLHVPAFMVVSGDEVGKDGQPVRMILMKIKQEWYEEDQKLVEQRNEQVAAALRGGLMGAERDAAGDTQHRYVDPKLTKIPDLFTPKRPKRA